MTDVNQIITWLRDQAIRAPEDVLKRGMNQAADMLESLSQRNAQLEEAAKNSYTVQQIEEIQCEAYDLGVDSVLHNHFGLTWANAEELRKQIAAIQEQHRWIPVTERLPEPMQHIIAVGRNFPWLESAGPVLDTFVYNPDAYQPWMEYITHWMPWPGFPKEAQ